MAEARAKDNWAHTSCVLAMIANTSRDPKKTRPFKPDDFNPFSRRRRTGMRLTADNVRVLKEVFVDRRRET